jgi:SAM-dependent methyltransferase
VIVTEEKRWRDLELEYARRLRSSDREKRKALYVEAYSTVAEHWVSDLSTEPERRTAGTSPNIVNSLIRLCDASDHVLEVGCGRGYTCLKLAPHVRSLVGIDVSDPVLKEAREILYANQVSNVEIIKGSADELTACFESETFDKVISIDVYEHLHPIDAAVHLVETHAVLRPGGRFIIVTPNRSTGPHDITRDLFPDAKEALGFHLNETTCKNLVQEMKRVGFVKFRSLLPISFRLPVPFDIIYPSSLFVLIERKFQRLHKGSVRDRLIDMISSIFLIAERC